MSKNERKVSLRSAAFYRHLRASVAERASNTKAIRAEALRRVRCEMISAGVAEPPVNLRSLALRLKLRDIVFVPLPMRGRVMLDGNNVVVEVNENLGQHERRWTIAHELAHLILEKERVAIAEESGRNIDRSISHGMIEQLCDLCADEILLPQEWLRKKLPKGRGSLQAVVEISRRADVSVDFTVTRLIELGLQPWRAIWCVKVNQEIQIVKSVPHWDESFLVGINVLNVEMTPISSSLESDAITQGYITLQIHDDDIRYPAQCAQISKDTVLCILHTGRR